MTQTDGAFGEGSATGKEVEAIDLIVRYHERTRHRTDGFAIGPEFLDWDDQPDPFRRFSGSDRIVLPLLEGMPDRPYRELFSGLPFPALPVDGRSAALLFEVSLGLSAWKSYPGARWSLRINPSSGNLHPTEAYLICPDLPGLPGGVYHYLSLDHALERRFSPGPSWKNLWPSSGFFVGLSGIHWREAWKYGERAFRYCQHDTGHALAAIRFAAAALGWKSLLLEDWGDEELARLLGVDRLEDFPLREREAPEALVWVGPEAVPPDASVFTDLPEEGVWTGTGSEVSPEHRRWDVINEADGATRKGRTVRLRKAPDLPLPPVLPPRTLSSFGTIARQRRSAQRFDRQGPPLPASDFFRMLDCLLPRPAIPPFDLLPWSPKIHPVFFVYNVEGMEPGCYLLPRDPEVADELGRALRADFLWEKVPGAPEHLPVRCLLKGDGRGLMETICCRQQIASQSLFSVAMLAEFLPVLAEGAHGYRWLHWEAGVVGQSLYLEAEAASVRGTGIGCFFDDEMHRFLGLKDRKFQSLYHFTVGHPVDDSRLETRPPYEKG